MTYCPDLCAGDLLDVFGGERDQWAAFAAAESYDPASGRWLHIALVLVFVFVFLLEHFWVTYFDKHLI